MTAWEQQLDVRRWEFAGPVERAYELSRQPVAMIVGPTGGGKSTGSARRCLRVATWQHASPRDGVRRARILCICPTYRRAWDTVMPSYFKVFPQTLGMFRGARGDPADHIFETEVMMGGVRTRLHVEVLFRAVQEMDIEEFLRGFEFTALWLPEADTNGDLATDHFAEVQPGRPLSGARRPAGQRRARLHRDFWRRQRPRHRICLPRAVLLAPHSRRRDGAQDRPLFHSARRLLAQRREHGQPAEDQARLLRTHGQPARSLRRRADDPQPAGLWPPRPAGAPEFRSGNPRGHAIAGRRPLLAGLYRGRRRLQRPDPWRHLLAAVLFRPVADPGRNLAPRGPDEHRGAGPRNPADHGISVPRGAWRDALP